MWAALSSIITSVTIFDIIDIAIIALIIFKLLQMIRGSRTIYMVGSIISLIVLLVVSKYLGLKATGWILSNFTGYLVIIIVILFQPEIRRALVTLSESRFFSVDKKVTNRMLDEIVRAATILANRQIGALIVLERQMELLPIVTPGQFLDSEVSRDLLISIFIPYSPLHDGAVLINGSRITYASCILPLTKREDISKSFGTRHRAAIGITEETDAIVVVVSEERGSISLVSNGVISTELDAEALQNSLESLFKVEKDKKADKPEKTDKAEARQ